jgi:hypothetical protein
MLIGKSTTPILGAVTAVSILAVAVLDLAKTGSKNNATDSTFIDTKVVDGPETQLMRAMTADIEFITEYSTLEYAGQALPDVIVVTENEIQLRYYSTEALVGAEQGGRVLGRVAAFFDREANTIFLADLRSIDGTGLLHELVHYLQDINGKDDMFADHLVCLEAEAYDIQALWQTLNEVDLASKPDYGFVITLYGACNDANFSWVNSP